MSERVPLAIVVMASGGREVPVGTLDGGLHPDLALVDDLLKFVLAAGRLGWAVRVREPHPHLRELIDLLGMGDRLGLTDDPGPPGGAPALRVVPLDDAPHDPGGEATDAALGVGLGHALGLDALG